MRIPTCDFSYYCLEQGKLERVSYFSLFNDHCGHICFTSAESALGIDNLPL